MKQVQPIGSRDLTALKVNQWLPEWDKVSFSSKASSADLSCRSAVRPQNTAKCRGPSGQVRATSCYEGLLARAARCHAGGLRGV